MTIADFQSRVWLSSVQLVRVDASNSPDSTASGALIDYAGKRLLVTVEHATGDQKRWAIQLRHVPDHGTQLYGVGAMNFLAKGSLNAPKKKLETVDFSYVEVPGNLQAFRQEFDPTGSTLLGEALITVHTPSLTDVPDTAGNYGFCGMVKAQIEQHPGKTIMGGELRIYSGLKFLRTEEDFHIFELPFPHPGHEHFKGCSGAPVLSEDGKLVGLVSGGEVPTNQIRVLSLASYKTPIDAFVGNIG